MAGRQPYDFACVAANKALGYTIVPFRGDDGGVVETMPGPYVHGMVSITNKTIQSQAHGVLSAAARVRVCVRARGCVYAARACPLLPPFLVLLHDMHLPPAPTAPPAVLRAGDVGEDGLIGPSKQSGYGNYPTYGGHSIKSRTSALSVPRANKIGKELPSSRPNVRAGGQHASKTVRKQERSLGRPSRGRLQGPVPGTKFYLHGTTKYKVIILW